MNERLFRTQFNQMENIEKHTLMESLAARYDMTFLGLHTFDRWGQSCTTGIFKKDGREFVFVPGDTVTLGWERFAVGLNQESREELEYLFREWEMERDPEEMIRESMAPVRQAVIGPMLVGRELEELCWEPVKMDDPRLTTHPDWLKEFRDFAWSDSSSLTLHQSARIERTEDGFQTWIYHCTDYDALLAGLEKQGLSLPTADEWAYLCGGGCRTLFPWGDGLDYTNKMVDMFTSESSKEVTLLCENELMRVIIDHYGEDAAVDRYDDTHFTAKIEVNPSGTFYGWIFKFKGKIKILSPKECITEMQQIAQEFI